MNPICLHVLYATVSGTAREIAETLALEYSDQLPGPMTVQDMHDADDALFDPAGPPLLLVVATTGAGDLPADALRLYQSLQEQPRYLGALRYGLIALGDSSYGTTFCGGGHLFDATLLDMGAQRISDMLVIDAIEENDPAGLAVRWFRHWAEAAGLSK